MTLALGAPIVDVDAVLTGPGGGSLGTDRHDSALTVGDPVGVVMMGWHGAKWHVQLSRMITIPLGPYRADQLATLSLPRFAVDGPVAHRSPEERRVGTE